jgi:hypothetical protein
LTGAAETVSAALSFGQLQDSDTEWQSQMAPWLESATSERPSELKPNSHLVEMVDEHTLRGKLLPFGTTRVLWDGLTLLLVLYTAVVLPVDLLVLPREFSTPLWMEVLEVFMDFVFMVRPAPAAATPYPYDEGTR